MAHIDKSYHNLLEKILQEGYTYEDPNRKGVNRLEIPSYTFRHEFKDEFHYITDKELCGNISLDKIISEMKPDWFKLENYESYPGIRVEMLERDE